MKVGKRVAHEAIDFRKALEIVVFLQEIWREMSQDEVKHWKEQ